MLFWKDVGNGILLDRPLPFKSHQSYRPLLCFIPALQEVCSGLAKKSAVMTVMTSTPRLASHYRGEAVMRLSSQPYFKLIYKYYPSNYFLVNRFNCNIDTRIFCGLHIETFFHLFWSCPYSANFWSDFCSFVRDHNMPSFQLCFENVLLVFSTYDMSFHKEYYFTNLLLLN